MPWFEHGSGLHDEMRLAQALQDPALVARFDVVIVDTPPSPARRYAPTSRGAQDYADLAACLTPLLCE